jgi:POT family proton-dependent oligopeptide transporter
MGRLFHKMERKRDLGFIISHFSIELGAFLSGLFVGSYALDPDYGFNYGFGIIALATLINLVLFSFFRNKLELIEENIDNKKNYVRAPIEFDETVLNSIDIDTAVEFSELDDEKSKFNPFILILVVIGIIIFHNELGGILDTQLLSLTTPDINSLDEAIFSVFGFSLTRLNTVYLGFFIPFLIGIVLFVYWYTRGLGSTILKFSLSLFLLGLSFVFVNYSMVLFGDRIGDFWVITLILLGLSSLLLEPIAISYITRLSNTSYTSTILGFTSVATYLGNIFLAKLLSPGMDSPSLVTCMLLTFGLLFLLLIGRNKLMKLSNGLN